MQIRQSNPVCYRHERGTSLVARLLAPLLLAWLVFSILLAGRTFRGWRGKRAIKLYLGGFALLCLAYFGSRYILEEILNRSWS